MYENEDSESSDETQRDLAALINRAEDEGKWLHCSYQNLWFSPQELRKANSEGRMRWGVVNWTLRDPGERVMGEDAVSKVTEDAEAHAWAVGYNNAMCSCVRYFWTLREWEAYQRGWESRAIQERREVVGVAAEAKVASDWMAELQGRARTECGAWDDLAKALGVDLDAPRWNLAGARAVGWARPMGPSRKAMPRCESGGRDYCSCDICF